MSGRRRPGRILGCSVSVLLAFAPSAVVWALPAPTAQDSCPAPCLRGDGDVFSGEDERGIPANPVGGADREGVGRPGRTSVTEAIYTPACSGNTSTERGILCPTATVSCPISGDVRFWVYRRLVNVLDRVADPPFVRVLVPPSVCLGPADPRLDPVVAMPALVEREFARVVVLRGVAEVSPAPETLVNVETRFVSGSPGSYEIPLSLLGQSVVITATARSWTWFFGDGTTERVTAVGSGGRTSHVYSRTGERSAYVVTEWSGTFRIGSDPTERVVRGTATTSGVPVPVVVRQARAELVDRSG